MTGRLAAALGIAAALAFGGGPAAAQSTPTAERRVVDRAEGLRASGQAAAAFDLLAEHLDRAPGAVEALALLASIAGETGDPSRAIPYAEAAVGASPESARAHAVWTRTLIRSALVDSARAVAERRASARPDEPLAQLALAEARRAGGDAAGAAEGLRGSSPWRAGDASVGALLADLELAAGQEERAVATWARLLALDPPAVAVVVEDLRTLDDPDGAMTRLAARLEDADVTSIRAGAIVALRAGVPDQARRLAGRGRTGESVDVAAFLREYVREGEAIDASAEIAWAATELVALSPRPIDRMRWRALAADRSLAAGDTTAAREAYTELAGESEPGQGTHDVASRGLFSLMAADPASLETAGDLLHRYASAYPDSSRVHARMYGELALGHARGGDLARAEAVLAEGRGTTAGGAPGPIDAAGARIALYAGRRDSADARARRSLAEDGLSAGERTRRLGLLTVIQAADSAEVEILGRAALALLRDPAGFDPGPTVRELAGLPGGSGRPTVLAFLAGLAGSHGRTDVSLALWRRVAEAHPASAEAPQAMLELARGAAPPEAAAWLERLIVGYPQSALAPVARRMLSELEREGP